MCSRNAEADELQRELEEKLTELAKVARHLSEEDQEKLAAVIAELGPLEDKVEEQKDHVSLRLLFQHDSSRLEYSNHMCTLKGLEQAFEWSLLCRAALQNFPAQ